MKLKSVCDPTNPCSQKLYQEARVFQRKAETTIVPSGSENLTQAITFNSV